MISTTEACALPAPHVARMARAQQEIRRLTGRGRLSPQQRLELAEWQREWVAAWRESQYVIAA
ncbi:hypothetical protein [Streptantibioticus ferralitis]|uniref:Uncharacterized protein n=1 Tax=Streptantibioticus ferralitis TaxID=236510 RepID=A0ABT5ZEG2_9ACTN|nr:hypothetical protein [Streptantibioticus ferralitis]MDF2261420.1 hypothetical protein [Streptantibioticus ferralitis]